MNSWPVIFKWLAIVILSYQGQIEMQTWYVGGTDNSHCVGNQSFADDQTNWMWLV